MKIRITTMMFGLVISLIGATHVHAEQQKWQVVTGGWKAEFVLQIDGGGNVSGVSNWTNGPQGDAMSGKVSDSKIELVRDLGDGKSTQTFTGTYQDDRSKATGKVNGTGVSNQSWSTTSIVSSP